MASDHQAARELAYYFDGHSAKKHVVTITFNTESLTITSMDGGDAMDCPYAGTRRIRPYLPPEHVALRPTDRTGARLVLVDPRLIDQLRQHAPAVFNPPFFRRSRFRRWAAIMGTLAAAAIVILLIIPAVATAFAFLVPEATKRGVGESIIRDYFEPHGFCFAVASDGALRMLTDQLASTVGIAEKIEVQVTKLPIANAFALPGHRMVLTDQLIGEAETSAELAGVIAHELGHMKLKHPTESYFRESLISAVTYAIFGGVVGGSGLEMVADLAMTFSYSRNDEAAADQLAIDALNSAGITPRGIVDLFDRDSEVREDLNDFSKTLNWLSSHPSNADRRRRALDLGTGRNQALSARDWALLKRICD